MHISRTESHVTYSCGQSTITWFDTQDPIQLSLASHLFLPPWYKTCILVLLDSTFISRGQYHQTQKKVPCGRHWIDMKYKACHIDRASIRLTSTKVFQMACCGAGTLVGDCKWFYSKNPADPRCYYQFCIHPMMSHCIKPAPVLLYFAPCIKSAAGNGCELEVYHNHFLRENFLFSDSIYPARQILLATGQYSRFTTFLKKK